MTNSRSILITGATSGIGMYATKLFAQRGWIVWAGYRNSKGKELLSLIHPDRVRPIRLDVTDPKSIFQARRTILKSNIPLHVLCNNAGVAFGGPVELLDIGEVQKAFDVNFFGPLRMIQVFLPLLRQTSGRIVNISSLSGLVGIPFLVPTSSSKFALEGMSDSLRRELAGQHVSVSVIEPALIQTAIWKKSIRLSRKLLRNTEKNNVSYTKAMDTLMNLFGENSKLFTPIDAIKAPCIHAAESRYPKRRYLVYPYSSVIRFFITWLPDNVVDWLFKKVL